MIVKPVLQGIPSVQIINKKIVIRMMISSTVQPSCVWSFGGKTINSGGNFFTNVVKEGGNYVMLMEIDAVSLAEVWIVEYVTNSNTWLKLNLAKFLKKWEK